MDWKNQWIYYAVLWLILGVSCSTYTDPEKPDIDDQLQNKYCNIPTAVNYNWNFPGKEDNSICFYSWDFYEGRWQFINDVYAANNNVEKLYSDTIVLSFSKNAADTAKAEMQVSGWCGSGNFNILIDRFYIAKTDTMPNGFNYQIVCLDTISGTLEKNIMDTSTLSLKMSVLSPNGQFNYIGIGTKL